MSWTAQIRRVKEGLRQAVGISQTIEDECFEEKIKAWETRVQELRKLKEAIETYLDALAVSSMAGISLCEAINKVNNNTNKPEGTTSTSTPNADALNLFNHIMIDISNVVQTSIRSAIINRCLKPVVSMLNSVAGTYEKIARRKEIMMDFNAYSNKVHREFKANNPHLNRTTHKLEDVTKELSLLQTDICNCVDEWDDSLPEFVLSEVAVLSSSLYFGYSSSAMLMGQMIPIVPQGAATLGMLSVTAGSSPFLRSPSVANLVNLNVMKASLVESVTNHGETFETASKIPESTVSSSSVRVIFPVTEETQHDLVGEEEATDNAFNAGDIDSDIQQNAFFVENNRKSVGTRVGVKMSPVSGDSSVNDTHNSIEQASTKAPFAKPPRKPPTKPAKPAKPPRTTPNEHDEPGVGPQDTCITPAEDSEHVEHRRQVPNDSESSIVNEHRDTSTGPTEIS